MTHRFFFGLLIIFVVIFFGNTAIPHQPIATAQTNSPIYYLNLVWSPDGTHLAFTRGVGTTRDIGVYNFDTAMLIVLASQLQGDQYTPIWSPDSQQLAFDHTTEDATGFSTKIGMINRDGTGASILAETLPNDFTPEAFSLDGKIIYALGSFIDEEAEIYEGSLWAIDVANQQHQKIDLAMDRTPLEIVLSPDGSQLAFLTIGDELGQMSLWVATLQEMSLKDTNSIFLPSGAILELAWSPSGTSILCWELVNGTIYLVNSTTGIVTTFAQTLPNHASFPDWSLDGSSFAFQMAKDENILAATIWSINIDGSDLTELSAAVPGDLHTNVVWSPDGTQLAFIAYTYNEAGEIEASDIWRIQADGSNPINLTEAAPAE